MAVYAIIIESTLFVKAFLHAKYFWTLAMHHIRDEDRVLLKNGRNMVSGKVVLPISDKWMGLRGGALWMRFRPLRGALIKALIKTLIKTFALLPEGWPGLDKPDVLRAGSVLGDPALP